MISASYFASLNIKRFMLRLHSLTLTGSLVLQGIGEPTLFLGSSVFFAIKAAVAAARSESGLVGPFTLHSPATAERACLACASPFTQKVKNAGILTFSRFCCF